MEGERPSHVYRFAAMSILAASALLVSTGIVSTMFWMIARIPEGSGHNAGASEMGALQT